MYTLFYFRFSFQNHGSISTIQSNKIRFPESPPNQPYFIRQTIGNACGTIAILHALGNSILPDEDPSSSIIWSKLLLEEKKRILGI